MGGACDGSRSRGAGGFDRRARHRARRRVGAAHGLSSRSRRRIPAARRRRSSNEQIRESLAIIGIDRGRARSTSSRRPWTTDWIAPEAQGALKRVSASRRRTYCGARVDVAGISPLRRAKVAVPCPALRFGGHAAALAVRLDRVQGAIPLRRLPRAVRLLQAALTGPNEQVSLAARSPASSAKPGTPSPSRLRCPTRCASQFRFEQGQHLTLRTDLAGQDVRRSYSICSAVQDGTLRIAVKKTPGGVFSTWANEALQGRRRASTSCRRSDISTSRSTRPRRATTWASPRAAASRRSCRSSRPRSPTEPRSRFTLVYGNRASGTVMFKEELAALKDRYLDRFNLVHVLSREAQDIELLHGRIDRAKADALLAHWVQPGRHRRRVRLRSGRHDGRGRRALEGARLAGREDPDRALRGEHPQAHARRPARCPSRATPNAR